MTPVRHAFACTWTGTPIRPTPPSAEEGVESPDPSQGLSEEWPENGPPKAQPARKRSGKTTAAPDGLWRAVRLVADPPKGCGVGLGPVPDLSGQKDRGAAGRLRAACRPFFWSRNGKAGTGNSSHGIAHTAFRYPRRGRRPHRRLRRLGHARQLRLADRGAPRRAPRRRHVRRLAHVRGRPARRPRARLPAPPARERRRQADAARQGALFLHAARPRRRDRRPDRLLHERPVVPHGRQRRHARQGPRVAAPGGRRVTASRSSRAPNSR